jgi:FSR family fosmidomycin resistance protein-like MFS transporter
MKEATPDASAPRPRDKQPAHRFQTGNVTTIAAGHAVHDTFSAFLPSILPVLIEKFVMSRTRAGVLSMFLQAPSLMQPYFGHLADRSGSWLAVVLAPAATAVAMSLLGLAPGFWSLAVLLTVAGVSSAGLHAVAPVVAGRMAGRSLGRAMGFWMVGGEAGRTLGPIVIVSAIALLTLEGTAVLMVIGIATSVVLFFKLRRVAVTTSSADGSGDRPWRAAVSAMRPVLLPLTSVLVARSFAVASFAFFLPTFLTEGGSGLWTAGASLSVLEFAGIIGALTGGSISDRLGRRRVIAAGLLLTPVFAAVFLLTGGWVRYLTLLPLGFSLFSFGPVIMALVQEQFPRNRALANGIYMALAFLIRSVAVVAVGAIGDLFGLRVAFVAGGLLMVAGIPFVFALPRRPA